MDVKALVILVLASALIASPALADTVARLNGQTYEKEIAEETLEGHDSPDESENTAIASDAIAKGKARAEEEFGRMDKLKWFASGCLLNLVGVGLAWVIVSGPPQNHLIGRPPEYVEAFSKGYRDRATSLQVKYAATGCAATSGTAGACILVFGQKPITADPW